MFQELQETVLWSSIKEKIQVSILAFDGLDCTVLALVSMLAKIAMCFLNGSKLSNTIWLILYWKIVKNKNVQWRYITRPCLK